MIVEDILAQKGHQVFAVRPDCGLREMATIIATRNIGTMIVTDAHGAMRGIVSERDLVRAFSESETGQLDLKVGDLMTRSIVTCAPETSVADALTLMGSHRIRHLPVVKDGDVVGLISVRDLLEFRLEGLEENFAALIRAKRDSSRARKVAELVDQAKSEFLKSISYQLKAPLETIVDISEYLAGEIGELPVPPQFEKYLGEIEQTGRQMRTVVNDLLELSLLQAKTRDPKPEIVDLGEVAAACLRDVAAQAEQRGVTVQLDPAVEHATIVADVWMLGRMLQKLLANAVAFTQAGGVVTVACDGDGGRATRISVADTGLGIPTEHLAKVVEPFYRVETSLARGPKGAGLGLPLVEAMLKAHGGALSLESRIGTTATLCFPAAPLAGEDSADSRLAAA